MLILKWAKNNSKTYNVIADILEPVSSGAGQSWRLTHAWVCVKEKVLPMFMSIIK